MPECAAIVAAHAGASIRVERAPPGQRLGGLRNIAIARARGEWICQWDDDDRYHPERLRLQWEQAQSEQADVNYLVDQLHWFRADSLLFWDDWGGEPYPMNLIQGTILARRDVMPPYPDIGRGEDTLQTHALLREEASKAFRVSRLRGMGWCYIYRFHGGNAWDAAHHRAISAVKRLDPGSAPAAPRPATRSSERLSARTAAVAHAARSRPRICHARRSRLTRQARPERVVQAAFFLRSPAAPTLAATSPDDGPDSDVQIP